MNLKKYFILSNLLVITHLSLSQNFSWGSSFGGNGEDVVKAMHVDDAGNSYITGYFSDTANFDPNGTLELTSNGFYDAFIQKIDSNGNLLWAKSVGGDYFEHGSAITSDSFGNVYITGNYETVVNFDPEGAGFNLTSSGLQDIFILKLDINGEFVWAKSIGGTGFEEALSIIYKPGGEIILSGFFYDPIDIDPGSNNVMLTSTGASDTFLLRLDTNGHYIASQQYGGTDTDLAIDMAVNASGDLFITGYFSGTSDLNPNPIQEDFFTASSDGFAGYVLHLNNAGEFVSAGITHGGDVFSNGITVDDFGNAFVTGYFGFTVNFNHDIIGAPINLTSNSFYNGFVMKINPFGGVEWAKHLEGNDSVLGYDIEVNSNGDIITAGYYSNTIDLDPSANVFSLTQESSNASDAYISILDSNGSFLNGFQLGGINFIDANNLGVDAQDNIYTAAHFENTVDINPETASQTIVSAIEYRDNYIIKLIDGSLSIPDNDLLSVKLYPNPAENFVVLKGEGLQQGLEYKIFDVKGSLISSGKTKSNNSIDVTSLNSGMYLLKVAGLTPIKLIIK
ncbi:T9SS type A sorting domain-containing protein [Gaetbulibacter jejuensis]|uniref:Secretion system C-terminal sorting domain-containing protein n=1 Tax=Gaetbulibacter jejuensis TaxID=584607 RepID=A0ABP3V6P2_9FLAO